MTKISFIGDIMCEEPLQKACRHGSSYNFAPLFEGCRKLFSESDYVIGNLETVFAGEEAGYTKQLYSFNTPDPFADALAKSGIDMVMTAQNHILDRGKAGMLRTLTRLDEVGLEHIGTYVSEEERKEILVKEFSGCRVAFLNYVQSVNSDDNSYILDESEYYLVNQLMPQAASAAKNKKLSFRQKMRKSFIRIITERRYLKLRKMLHRSYANKFTDKLDKNRIREEYLERIRSDMKKARSESDLVVVSLHLGGQFNEIPGERTSFFTRMFADLGADYIINTHPHVVQGTDKIGMAFVAYCLGNFSISPSSVYIPGELKPEYSIVLHLYVDSKDSQTLTFSVLKICENKKHEIEVMPVDELYGRLESSEEKDKIIQDVRFIYSRFTGKTDNDLPVQREYALT